MEMTFTVSYGNSNKQANTTTIHCVGQWPGNVMNGYWRLCVTRRTHLTCILGIGINKSQGLLYPRALHLIFIKYTPFIFCVEFQRAPFNFLAKYLTIHWKIWFSYIYWILIVVRSKSSWMFLKPSPAVFKKHVSLGSELHNILCCFEWTSYHIRKYVGYACTGNAGNVFPATYFKENP